MSDETKQVSKKSSGHQLVIIIDVHDPREWDNTVSAQIDQNLVGVVEHVLGCAQVDSATATVRSARIDL